MPASLLFSTVDPDAVYILNSSSKDFLRGDVFIPTGTTHNFTCLATDTKPPAQIIWSFDGKDTGETTSVIGANLYNTSSALVVSSIQKGQHLNFTCTAIGLKKNASFTIRLIGQQRAGKFSSILFSVSSPYKHVLSFASVVPFLANSCTKTILIGHYLPFWQFLFARCTNEVHSNPNLN